MTSAPRLPQSPSSAPPSDPLTEALQHLRIQGVLYCNAEFRGAQAIAIPAFDDVMMFQIVTEGRVLLELEGEAPRWIGAGSLALMARGEGHVLRTAPTAPAMPLADLEVEPISDHYETATLGTEGESTRVMYGVIRFDHVAAARLVRLLPRLIVVDTLGTEHAEWLASTLPVIAREARHPRPGGEVVVTRLADVMVVETLRLWIESDRAESGWLAGLRDPQIGRALGAMHRNPAAPWTLATLAREAAMSRTSFAERFTALLGEPPMAYLADWRLRTARDLLRAEKLSIVEAALRVGYSSEASFGRAYKRAFGVSPGRDRRG